MRSDVVLSLLLANSASAVAFPRAPHSEASLAKRHAHWGGSFGDRSTVGKWSIYTDSTDDTSSNGRGRWHSFGTGRPNWGSADVTDDSANQSNSDQGATVVMENVGDSPADADVSGSTPAAKWTRPRAKQLQHSDPAPQPSAQPETQQEPEQEQPQSQPEQQPEPQPEQTRPQSQPEQEEQPEAQPQTSAQPAASTVPSGDSCASAPDAYASQALAAHNTRRADHGAGPLCWDDRLAAAAKMLSDKCVFGHNTELGGGNYGQNIAQGTQTIEAGVQMWYAEGNPGNNAYNHFTQVVWKASTKLGCAVSPCSGGPLTVCNYNPAGNMLGASALNVA